MTETFDCASCSAPLDFEGTAIHKCKFCGSTVIVPSQLISGSGIDASSPGDIAIKLAEIRHSIAGGDKVTAVKLFRELFGVGAKEAKNAVNAMEHGVGVDISATQIITSGHIGTADLKAVRNVGIALGGSILGTILLISLAAIGLISLIVFLTFRAVNKAAETTANSAVSQRNDSGKSATTEVLKFGGDGTGVGRFRDNRHVGTDSRGNIYSIEYLGGRMQVFDKEGKFVTQWQAGNIAVRGMTVSRDGIVYIAEAKGVTAFEGATGKNLARLDRSQIDGIALTTEGNVVAVGRDGIAVFDKTLKLLTEYKDVAKMASAQSGFESVAVDGPGNILAIDKSNNQLCKFAPDGKFLNRLPADLGSPNAITVDPKGNIFVSDTSRIIVLNERGQPIATLAATQVFGIAFNDDAELLVASRPFIIKYKVDL